MYTINVYSCVRRKLILIFSSEHRTWGSLTQISPHLFSAPLNTARQSPQVYLSSCSSIQSKNRPFSLSVTSSWDREHVRVCKRARVREKYSQRDPIQLLKQNRTKQVSAADLLYIIILFRCSLLIVMLQMHDKKNTCTHS